MWIYEVNYQYISLNSQYSRSIWCTYFFLWNLNYISQQRNINILHIRIYIGMNSQSTPLSGNCAGKQHRSCLNSHLDVVTFRIVFQLLKTACYLSLILYVICTIVLLFHINLCRKFLNMLTKYKCLWQFAGVTVSGAFRFFWVLFHWLITL